MHKLRKRAAALGLGLAVSMPTTAAAPVTARTQSAQPGETAVMNRLYNRHSGEHFYTADLNEKQYLVSIGWNDEGVGWTAPVISNHPVFRLYNPNTGDHHYTLDENEKNYLVKVGWNDEGIGWYSAEDTEAPLFRQFNPNVKTGSHNYTMDQVENDYLVKIGWKGEGVAWYALDEDSFQTVSKGQWISSLADALGIEGDDNFDVFFPSIADNDLSWKVHWAYYSGLFSADAAFDFDSEATREFAAYSTVKALLFQPSQRIECADASRIEQPKYAKTAIDIQLLFLQDNCFLPDRPLRAYEASQILNCVKLYSSSSEVPSSQEAQTTYWDEVVNLQDAGTDALSCSSTTLTLPKNEETAKIQEGSIVVLGIDEWYKALSVQEKGNTVQIQYSVPEAYEVFHTYTSSSQAYFDFDNLVLADGVSMEAMDAAQTPYAGDSGSLQPAGVTPADFSGSVDASEKKISLSGKEELKKGKSLKWSASVAFADVQVYPDIEYNSAWEVLAGKGIVKSMGNSRFVISLDIEGSLEAEISNNDRDTWNLLDNASIHLCDIPVVGIPGCAMYVSVDMRIDLSGSISTTYSFSYDCGCKFVNNQLQGVGTIRDQKWDVTKLGATLKAGPELNANIRIWNTELVKFAGSVGGAAKAALNIRDTGLICTDGKIYMYFDLDLLKDCKLNDWFKWGVTLTVLDDKNSPLSLHLHFEKPVSEPMRRVDKCTWKNKMPEDAVEFNGHHYYLCQEDEIESWQQASLWCESMGGHLATIGSQQENDFLFGYITNDCGVSSAYFGLSDHEQEGVWKWVTGETVSYLNWHSGEPNGENSNEDYAMFYWKFSDGSWNDGDFGNSTVSGGRAFLCEWDE